MGQLIQTSSVIFYVKTHVSHNISFWCYTIVGKCFAIITFRKTEQETFFQINKMILISVCSNSQVMIVFLLNCTVNIWCYASNAKCIHFSILMPKFLHMSTVQNYSCCVNCYKMKIIWHCLWLICRETQKVIHCI